MHVIFMAPNFPANQRQFVRALHAVGAKVTGIGDSPVEYLDSELKSWLSGYEHIPSLADEAALLNAVHRIQRRGWVDRLECTVEAIMLTTARVREQARIPGLSVDQVLVCRDKYVMKQYLRDRGIPCAKTAAINTIEEGKKYANEIGYPVIVKPRDGAGAHGTSRCDDDAQLEKALIDMGIGHPRVFVSIEEFVSGHEGFYDTLTCNGEVVFESISHYYPNVLEAMRDRALSPYIILTNRVEAEGYTELKSFGRRVVRELGLQTAPTHMEWFFGPKGLYFSEIGARPPGCWANDMDLYTNWAEALVFGATQPKPSRRYSAGLISIRANREGRVTGYSGLEKVQEACGRWLGEVHLPAIGSRVPDVGAGYMGHGWLHVRHPDYDECRKILEYVGATLKIWAD